MTIKDSGTSETYDSGMVRDSVEGKVKYDLVLDGPMFERWAKHLTAGGVKRGDRNWMRSEGTEELERFRESAFRHMVQWLYGDMSEDHAAAIFFNVNGAEFVTDVLAAYAERALMKVEDSAIEAVQNDAAKFLQETLDRHRADL